MPAVALVEELRVAREEQQRRVLEELLQEIRVALPGIQILFAFLLSAAFTDRFSRIDPGARVAYLAAVALSVLTTVLYITPSALHRMQEGTTDVDRLIRESTVAVLLGHATLACTLALAVGLITRLAYSPRSGQVAALLTLIVALLAWFAFPVYRRLTNRRSRADRHSG